MTVTFESMKHRMRRSLVPWGLVVVALAALVAPAATAESGELQILAYSLKHRPVSEALALVRPLLTTRGTVEEQRRGNTLVVRDEAAVLKRVGRALSSFDVPPKDMRLHIQVVQAGPHLKSVVSPPVQAVSAGSLSPELESRLRGVLRYEDYRVLAQADVPSKEGQGVNYSLGDEYQVSYRLGQVIGERRLKLEDFRIKKRTPSTNKGRQLEPRELYHATFNLWLEKPFMLVITQDPGRQEALLIAISARPVGAEATASGTGGPAGKKE
ncbi:MAG: secretin N-terminal domain-containing protein [Acidobacteriota bacterium]